VQDVVVVDRVTKVYPNGVEANVDVSLRVCSGEIACVLGPNGAGKTTLIRQVMGILRPTRGSVRVFGLDPVVHQGVVKRRIAYVPQLPVYYPHETVVGISEFFAKLYGVPLGCVKEVLEALDLWGIRDRKGEGLSPGERKLLLFALALIKGGDLYVLDEPTAFMDVLKKRTSWEMLLGERREGKTMIVVSHDVEEVRRICDRIYIMFGGRLVASIASPSELSRGVEVRVYYGRPGDIADFFRRGEVKVSEESLVARYAQLADAVGDLQEFALSPVSREARVFLEYPSTESIVEFLGGGRGR
jgi:ABC-2 type transport system ATP-binding protein